MRGRATGKAIDIGPEPGSIPVTKVTREAGSDLHWSGDSKQLHWALGPELFERFGQRERSPVIDGGAGHRHGLAGQGGATADLECQGSAEHEAARSAAWNSRPGSASSRAR